MTAALTEEEVLADLGVGRWRPLTVPAPLAPRRPALGGPASIATLMGARMAVRLGLPVAGSLLEKIWFTPWTVGTTRPRPDGAHAFDVHVRDAILSGWDVGDGPTILLVHGWGGRSTDLALMATRLVEAGYRAVAVDLPAHGSSPGTTTDLFELRDAVVATAAAAGPLAGIVAHSLGSVAALLAVADGLAVERLAVLAPPAALDTAVRRQVRRLGIGRAGEARLRARVEQRYGPDVWRRLDAIDTGPRVASDALVVHDVDDREVPVGEGVRVARALGTEAVLTTGLGHGRILADEDVATRVVHHLAG